MSKAEIKQKKEIRSFFDPDRRQGFESIRSDFAEGGLRSQTGSGGEDDVQEVCFASSGVHSKDKDGNVLFIMVITERSPQLDGWRHRVSGGVLDGEVQLTGDHYLVSVCRNAREVTEHLRTIHQQLRDRVEDMEALAQGGAPVVSK